MSIFPDTASVIRLVGALLVEINDEMIAAERRYISGFGEQWNRIRRQRGSSRRMRGLAG